MQFLSALKKRNHTTSSAPADTENAQQVAASIANKERGDVLMREAQWEAAAKCYVEAVTGNPIYVGAHLNLGFVLMQQGLHQNAQQHLARVLELDPTVADAHYLLGTFNAAQGRPTIAEEHFRKTLQQTPDFFPAYSDLCSLLMQHGRLDDAVQFIRDGVKRNPGNADLHYLLGNLYFEQRQLDLATTSFNSALDIDANHPQACANLGLTLLTKGELDQAATVLQKALLLNPNSADACNNLGNALHGQRKFDQAITAFNQGLAIDPRSARLHGNLGLSLHASQRFDDAIAQFHAALSLDPAYTDAHFNLGNSLLAQRKSREAIASFKTFLDSNPRHLEARNNLGNALQELGESDAALACLELALAVDPNYAAAHYSKGNILRSQGKIETAIECFREAVKNDADFLDAYAVLGDVMFDQGHLDEAGKMYRRVLEIDQHHNGAHWFLAMLTIPAIPTTNEDVLASRVNFSRAIADLNTRFDEERIASGAEQVGNLVPFYLVYQEENNRALMADYGQLCSRLLAYWSDNHLPTVASPQSDGRIRIGIVSAHIFKNHSVWVALVKGWFDHYHPDRIELHVFYLGTHEDEETAWARSRSASFEAGKRDFAQWAEIIQGKQVDALIYPEIGMDRLTVKLASLRLAPVQVTTWGQPETSGLPTIDYYLSAADLEPTNAQDNYTEKLVLLPKLGCHYYPSKVKSSPPDLLVLGVAADAPLLVCPGMPFKYAPKHDHVFVDIARKLGKCQFVFFSSHLPALTDKLRSRLKSAFADAGMSFDDFCVFIPWQDKATFFGLMKRADVFLDTIGFSGFNTAILALECDLPIVTREGRFMRGRLASGILRRMGLHELVTENEEDYIALAVKLVQDQAYRDSIRQRIAPSRDTLFNDRSSVAAWEEFLVAAVNAQRQANAA